LRIACLGWGSLIWSPRSLPMRGGWYANGPRLPIEFSRVAADGRVTLVVTPGSSEIACLWVELESASLLEAGLALARREKIPIGDEGVLPGTVGYWSSAEGSSGHDEDGVIAVFARAQGLDAVVWTRLLSGLSEPDRGRVPGPDELVAHLEALDPEPRGVAEAYVRNTPRQIDTPNRRRFERHFGWTPSELAHPRAREREGIR